MVDIWALYTNVACRRRAASLGRRACRSAGVPVSVRNAENDVKLGISRVQKALAYEILSVSPVQEHLIEEFGTYAYDPKSIERGKEEPIKIADHCVDAERYLIMGAWTKIRHWLPAAEREDK